MQKEERNMAIQQQLPHRLLFIRDGDASLDNWLKSGCTVVAHSTDYVRILQVVEKRPPSHPFTSVVVWIESANVTNARL